MEHLALAYVYATIPRWIFGALLCLASCVIINLGMVIQKRSVKFSAVSRPVYLQPQWLSGFTIFLLGQIVSLWSLSMAPQSMLSSLGSVSLVSNSILAPLLLGEKHTAVSLYSTGVLLAGSLLVVSCSSHQSQEYSPAALMDLFIRPQFLALTTVIVLSLGYLVLRRLRKGQLESVYFGTLSALLGALSVLFAKCVSILVLGGNALKPVDTTMRLAYILLLLLNITFSILSVYVMNLGIIRYRALDILPVYYSLAVVFQTITGGILFQEFVQLSFGQCLGLTLGVLLTCAGVQTIASGSPGDASGGVTSAAREPLLGHVPQRRSYSESLGEGKPDAYTIIADSCGQSLRREGYSAIPVPASDGPSLACLEFRLAARSKSSM